MKALRPIVLAAWLCSLLPQWVGASAPRCSMCDAPQSATAPGASQDSTAHDTLHIDTLREVEVRPDSVLPVQRALDKTLRAHPVPKGMSLGDIVERLSPGINDKITHPFAVKQRKDERRKKKMRKALEEYDHVKTFNELLDEAVKRQLIEDERARREAQQDR